MRTIELSQGKVTKVDDADFEHLNQWKWSYNHTHAVRNVKLPNGKTTLVSMHRYLCPTPPSVEVDHEDCDTLNNQRYNLRPATLAQQQWNKPMRRDNTSGFKGVCAKKNRFRAAIRVGGKTKYVGSFKSAEDAARAYDSAAVEQFGTFARTNAKMGLLEPKPRDMCA